MTARAPWDVLQAVVRSDATAPRVTFYERTPGATQGERIELSGKVLLNWVSKAANLLVEEFDVAPGSRVGVHLPAAHWRTVYWSLAAWSAGACVVFVDADAGEDTATLSDVDVLVTCRPGDGAERDLVVVTLAMLARSASEPVPAGALDEARELSTFGDVFAPTEEPDLGDVALEPGAVTFAALENGTASPGGRLFLEQPSPALVLAALAADGGVVLVRGVAPDDEVERILAQESAARA